MKDYKHVLIDEIYRQYPSIRAFAKACDVPHGTIVSALNNGIEGMAYAKVQKMCKTLNLDMNTFEPIFNPDNLEDKQRERVLAYFSKMSTSKQEKVLEYMQDIL